MTPCLEGQDPANAKNKLKPDDWMQENPRVLSTRLMVESRDNERFALWGSHKRVSSNGISDLSGPYCSPGSVEATFLKAERHNIPLVRMFLLCCFVFISIRRRGMS